MDGIDVDVLSFNRVSASDLVRYDGIIINSTVYFGRHVATVVSRMAN